MRENNAAAAIMECSHSKKGEEKLVPILPNIVPFHHLLNGSVHNSKIFYFEVLL